MASIELRGVTKRFPDGTEVLRRLDLSVQDGELLVLVGPSGCGKTTVLRLIAGLEHPTSGDVLIGDEVVTGVATQDRDVAMVFQERALLPFLNVGRNVSFPLEIARVPQDEREARVLAEARVHHLERLLERKPDTLSAGYQQLVQIAREMVRVPRVFLMDEPLARLDAAQRVRMRHELILLQRGYRVTTVYVTPDPSEAMAIGDRVAVLDAGEVQQVAAPQTIYRRPANTFVAGFFAPYPMNLIEAEVSREGRRAVLTVPGGTLQAWSPALEDMVSRRVLVGIRPEHVVPAADAAGEPSFRVEVDRAEFLGDSFAVHVSLGRESLVMSSTTGASPGTALEVALPIRRLHVFDADDGTAIAHPL
jgi:multiple sugar transport system ATP-binding protein